MLENLLLSDLSARIAANRAGMYRLFSVADLWCSRQKTAIFVKNATFVNDLTIYEINKSDKPEYKYLVKANVDFYHFVREDFNKLIKGYSGVFSIANFGEFIEVSELRRQTYNTYKNIGSRRITIHYYTNDNKFIDMNKGDVFNAKGTLQSINAPGILKEISFYEVFEN